MKSFFCFRSSRSSKRRRGLVAMLFGAGLWLGLSLGARSAFGVEPPPVGGWRMAHPEARPVGLRAAAEGAGRLVMVGRKGAIWTRENDGRWLPRVSNASADLTGVTHGDGGFVAVGGGIVLRSRDGIEWASGSSGMFDANGVAFGEGVYIAVDGLGSIHLSRDGAAWTEVFSSEDESFQSVAYGAGRFAAAGMEFGDTVDYGVIRVSDSGSSWRVERRQRNEEIRAVAFGNNLFVAAGGRYDRDFNELPLVLTSATGNSWSARAAPGEGALTGIAAGKGLFAGVGFEGMLVSPNGGDWRKRLIAGADTLEAIAFGQGAFFAFGEEETFSSSDGAGWGRLGEGAAVDFKAAAARGEILVAAGETSSGAGIWRSEGGRDWLNVAGEDAGFEFEDVVFANGLWVACGLGTDPDSFDSFGRILVSTDGKEWRETWRGSEQIPRAIGFGNGRFAAVGLREGENESEALVLTSGDGFTWTRQAAAGVAEELSMLAFGGGSWFSTSDGSVLWTSPDGVAWKRIALGQGGFRAMAHGNGRLVLAGDERTGVYQAEAGWKDAAMPGAPFRDVTFVEAEGMFYGAGDDGGVFKTRDGLAWEKEATRTSASLRTVRAFSGGLVAAGANGAVLIRGGDGAWSARNEIRRRDLRAVAVGADRVVAVGKAGAALHSSDGGAWEFTDGGSSAEIVAVTFHAGHFHAADASGHWLASSTGIDWERRVFTFPGRVRDMAGGNVLTAVGDGGLLAVLADGRNWAIKTGVTSRTLNGVASGPLGWIAAANGGTVLLSADGTEWREEGIGSAQNLMAAAVGNDRYAAASEAGGLWMSTNGLAWKETYAGKDLAFADVIWGDGMFLAVGNRFGRAVGLASNDGITWKEAALPDLEMASGLAAGNGSWFVTGAAGGIGRAGAWRASRPLSLRIRREAAGSFWLDLEGPPGSVCRIERADRIPWVWSAWRTVNLEGGKASLSETFAAGSASAAGSFFRLGAVNK